MKVSAVIFDLDDTLIEEESHARASLRSTARLVPGIEPARVEEVVLATARTVWRAGAHHRLALELGIGSWEGLWASFAGCHPKLAGLAAWAPTYRLEAWRAAVSELGAEPALAEAMAAAYQEAQRAGHPFVKGAPEVVRGAAEHHRLAMLTNGPPDLQHLKLDQTGLASFFDALVISGEVGVGKPAPEAFELVLDALGVSPAETVMVGDSWERDVKGALGAGIHPIWVARGRPVPESDPDVSIIASIGALHTARDGLGG